MICSCTKISGSHPRYCQDGILLLFLCDGTSFYRSSLTSIEDDPSLPLVFLEAQMQRDRQFYGRYFAEIFLYLYQYEIKRPWYALLILPNRSQNLGSDIPYQALINSQV
jgi:predicted transposase YdaD